MCVTLHLTTDDGSWTNRCPGLLIWRGPLLGMSQREEGGVCLRRDGHVKGYNSTPVD